MARAHRGEYRAILTVLLDGPDYQALESDARLTFLTAKLSCGPTGIDVFAGGVPATLSARTGLPLRRLDAALEHLAAEKWVEFERNVFWVVRHLEFEPALTLANPKHITGVRSHIGGLPRLAIVKRFIMHYPAWFAGIDSLSNGYPEATHTPLDSHTNLGIRDKGRGIREDMVPFDSHSNRFEAAWAVYPKRPNNSKADARRAWDRSVKAGADPEAMVLGTQNYAAFVEREKTEPKFIRQGATFFGPGRHWESDYGVAEKRKVPAYDEHGNMHPEMAVALGLTR